MDSTDPDFSIFTSRVMDSLGYSYHMIQGRKRLKHVMEKRLDENGTAIYAGSKAEGITSLWENDTDIMFVLGDIICTNDVSKYANIPNMTVFATERELASPGYTFLRLAQYGQIDDYLLDFIDGYRGDGLYIPNNFPGRAINLTCLPSNVHNVQLVGPSVSMTVKQCLPLDTVLAFKCECPEIKRAFLYRQRKYDQPLQETLNEIARLDTHVVAVGNKFSDRHDLEWRICDTAAEILLIGELTETQIQLYILLKLLAKSVLNEMDDMSSYVLKNVVLWMAELIPREKFQKDLLVQRLLHALKLLRQCVKRRYLPNYMFPQRNMFSGKLKRQKKVLQLLTNMIDEGQTVVLLCPRLKEAMLNMFESPERTRCRGVMRERMELMMISLAREDYNMDNEAACELVVWIIRNCWQDLWQFLMNDIDYDNMFIKLFSSIRQIMI